MYWYPLGKARKGTVKRAVGLTKEYKKKLRDHDVRCHGAAPLRQGQPEPPSGPLVSRFRDYGALCEGRLVAGPWGDLSSLICLLLKHFCKSKVGGIERSQGWEAGWGCWPR